MSLFCPHCQSFVENAPSGAAELVVCPACGGSLSPSHDATADWGASERKTLGKFSLLHPLGAGSYGTVYKARDTELGRIVAIKAPRASALGSGTDSTTRFLREARSTAQLRHPSIVPIYEVGMDSGTPFIVSEFVSGITLADLLTSERLTFRAAAELTAELAEALDYAHKQGVVHRDVKPANVMLERGQENEKNRAAECRYLPRLMDFGLARSDAAESTMTRAGEVIGTPAYMSPEQARGEGHEVDGRSDVYGLGVIFYQLLTGELPFKGNLRMLLHQVLHDEPQPPRRRNLKIPRDLDTICQKAMAKDAKDRYQSAGEMASDLRRFLADRPILARPTTLLARAWKWQKRNRVVAGLSLALLLSLTALVVYAMVAQKFTRVETIMSRQMPDIDQLAEVIDRLDREDPDWRLDQIEAKRTKIADDENGAIQISAISTRLREKEWGRSDPGEFLNKVGQLAPREPLPEADRSRLKDMVSAAGPLRDQARELIRYPRGRFNVVYARNGIATIIGYLPQARSVSDLLVCDAMLCSEEGEAHGAAESLLSQIHVATAIGDEPGLIPQLTRGAILDRGLTALERLLAQHTCSEADLMLLQQALEEAAKTPMPYIGARGERGNEHWQMTAVHAGDLEPSGFFVGADPAELAKELPRGQAFRPIHAWLLDHSTQLVEMSRPEQPGLQTQLAAWEESVLGEKRIPPVIRPYFTEASKSRSAAVRMLKRRTGRLHSGIAMLASERYRLQHRQWPSALADLTPALLIEIPKDPFSSQPLLLHRNPDGITIYSMGKDEIDNHGAIHGRMTPDSPSDIGLRLWDQEQRRSPAP